MTIARGACLVADPRPNAARPCLAARAGLLVTSAQSANLTLARLDVLSIGNLHCEQLARGMHCVSKDVNAERENLRAAAALAPLDDGIDRYLGGSSYASGEANPKCDGYFLGVVAVRIAASGIGYWANSESRGHSHQIGERFGFHLLHHVASMCFHGDLADSQLPADLFVE